MASPQTLTDNRQLYRARTWARYATAQRIAWWSIAQAGHMHKGMTKSDWAGVRTEMPWTSVRNCDTVSIGADGKRTDVVEVRAIMGDGGVVAYSGAAKCSLRSGCPRCRGPILAQRQKEVTHAAMAHTREGLGLGMGTLTVRHNASDELGKLVDGLLTAWQRVQQSDEWLGLRGGMVGTHRVLEVTVGAKHGWHPHLHVLLFEGTPGGDWAEGCHARVDHWSRALEDSRFKGVYLLNKLENHESALDRRTQRHVWAEAVRLKIVRNQRWEARCKRLLRRAEKMLVGAEAGSSVAYLKAWLPQFWGDTVADLLGEDHRPSLRKGVHLMAIGVDAAAYVSKLADEVTREDSKDSDPMALLDLAGDGEEIAVMRWIEYSAALHGRKISAFGGNVVERYTVAEVEDSDAAQALRGGVVVEVLPVLVWRALLKPEVPGAVPEALRLLQKWETALDRCPLLRTGVRLLQPRQLNSEATREAG